MANGLGYRRALAAAGLALGCAASAPAQAQFMSGYPTVIVVPPPPAQSMVMPKRPTPKQTPPATAAPPSDTSEPHQLTCRYQGQTRVCE